MFSKIHYTVANHTSPSGEQELVPRLKSGSPEEFMDHYHRQGQFITPGTMVGCLYAMRDALIDMMSNGTPIHLPSLGTFTLSLGGKVEVRDGKYVGSGVHVDGIRFTPDEELLQDLGRLEVEQTPLPVRPYVDDASVEAALATLFATGPYITRRDLAAALDHTLSNHRLSDLLSRLVADGRLVREGTGNKTRYRKFTSN
ncbi:MAG: hypothetical protein IJQ60_15575 [Prevotella sp.]|nr:hypothetical protein [Prevotella sp.]